MSTKDGGPAFPIPGTASHQHDAGCSDVYTVKGLDPVGGMSLRDYFAAKAMAAKITAWGYHTHTYSEEFKRCDRHISKRAYEVADAMLAARKQTP